MKKKKRAANIAICFHCKYMIFIRFIVMLCWTTDGDEWIDGKNEIR